MKSLRIWCDAHYDAAANQVMLKASDSTGPQIVDHRMAMRLFLMSRSAVATP